MKGWIKKHKIFSAIIIVLILISIGFLFPESYQSFLKNESKIENQPQEIENITNKDEIIKIANWNLQIFGTTKASKDELMNKYASIIDDYDIIFIQEIRNSDQTAFPRLCALLFEYNCNVSSRAGRSSSKEQYGVIYKKGIEIKSFRDYNPDSLDRWERPPIEVKFDIEGYDITAWNIHTKPEDVQNELNYLDKVVSDSGNVIILGYLNADCNYYDNIRKTEFDPWNWIIEDSEDTTVKSTDCAYDRIIMNNDAYSEYKSYGIYTNVTDDMSDHYLVWVELKI